MVNAPDSRFVVIEFELQSRYYVHFRTSTLGKATITLILPAIGVIVPLLPFSKDGFGINLLNKVDMLYKQTKYQSGSDWTCE